MSYWSRNLFRLSITIAWLSAFCSTPARAAESIEELRQQALQMEKAGDWAKACSYYAYILSKDRDLTDVKDRFQTCFRHLHRVQRHRDASYREHVLNQDAAVALKIYGEVLAQLQADYLEEDKADVQRLFRHGVEELRLALKDEAFRRQYVPDVKPEAVDAFLAKLADVGSAREIRHSLDAQNQALQVALAARKDIGLKPVVTVLEFACGACNALDEHTYYLTPQEFLGDETALRGQTAGVGIELAHSNMELLVARVVINSPADKAGVAVGDRIRRIDRTVAELLSLETARDMLRGKAGEAVEVEVAAANGLPRTLTLVKRLVNASVTDFRILDDMDRVAYLQLANFQANTLAELDEALGYLQMQGMKALVLDLRGNPGGLFDASVQVAERFLPEGAFIVGTRGRARDLKRFSHNPAPLDLPLVVLIDDGTASAAEIVAGALKENKRARLVGQTTFGKGTVQHVVELKTVQAGGIRLTWAKFYSPLNHAYNGFGVIPDVSVSLTSMGYDDQLRAALQEAHDLAPMPPILPQ